MPFYYEWDCDVCNVTLRARWCWALDLRKWWHCLVTGPVPPGE